MGETLKLYLLKESRFSIDPPEGRVLYVFGKDGQVVEEELISSSEADPKIPYPLMNPLQSLFYKYYSGGNALVASPTSSGKSLTAYLFMRAFRGKLVYLAPTKSLVKEKLIEFRHYYSRGVEMRTGESVLENFKESKAKLVVSTYEHFAFSLRNEARWLQGLEAVVVDEVHQIGKRWILEEIITTCLKRGLSMLCLSATLPGLDELAEWIHASLVINSAWRPVPLERRVSSLTSFRPLSEGLEGEELIASRLLNALFSLRERGEQVILFVPKKSLGWKLLEISAREKLGIMNQTVPFEVQESQEPEIAFHNADVPKEEREEIEKAFREGHLQTLIATQTLAYGVNLPADRVIIMTRFFRKDGRFRSIPDALDVLQMEGRAGRLGIKEKGYSDLLVYGAKDHHLQKELENALDKPFTTATMEEGISHDALSFFLLLAHQYERDQPEAYLEHTYSFRKLDRGRLGRIERFLKSSGYIQEGELSQKGLFCVRSGIPPTRFEEFLRRRGLQLPSVITVRPLLHMKKFDSLFGFLRLKGRFGEDLQTVRGHLLPCGEGCAEDNTDQFLFYVEGLTVRYANLKNPPGEFSYLSTDAIHLLRTLMEINRQGFYRFSPDEMLQIAHSVKYGISPEYASLSGIKGIGHIRANLIKEVLQEASMKAPPLGSPTESLLELFESENLYQPLFEKIVEYREMSVERARDEVIKVGSVLRNNRKGYMVDDRILLAFGLFSEGATALKRNKAELIELFHMTVSSWK